MTKCIICFKDITWIDRVKRFFWQPSNKRERPILIDMICSKNCSRRASEHSLRELFFRFAAASQADVARKGRNELLQIIREHEDKEERNDCNSNINDSECSDFYSPYNGADSEFRIRFQALHRIFQRGDSE